MLENKMYYLYLYSFGKLPLEHVRYTLAKCFYLHYSTTKLDTILSHIPKRTVLGYSIIVLSGVCDVENENHSNISGHMTSGE